ncbi:MAG: VOC family protein [Candidatus Binataceae bacterium]
MLKRVDRVQIAVANLDAAEKIAADTFGAELVRRDAAEPLAARRSTMQAGSSLLELLAPAGAGPVKDFVDRWTSGLFGVGFSVADLDAAARHLQVEGIKVTRDAGQLYVDPAASGFGMRVVLSMHHERAPVGAIKWIYETTNVVGDWRAASARYTQMFRLNPAIFVPIESKEFGYSGTLTMFDAPARLDRIEISQIVNQAGAMGRFHQKRGDSLYMFFVETDDPGAIATRLESRGARFAAHTRDEAGLAELFIHPSAFLGVLVGVSRTEHAWTWSGDVARARRAAASRATRR